MILILSENLILSMLIIVSFHTQRHVIMRYNNYFAYFLTFGPIRESHQTEFCYSSFTTDRMEQGMVTRSLDREIAGSRQHCILCFFIYRSTGVGVEVGDTGSGR